MPGPLTRIFSDIHYGERASRVHDLAQLGPMLTDADALILNGDTTDTRIGPFPAHTAQTRAEVAAFVAQAPAPLTLLTGNHDPDLSPHHWLELADGQVFVTHGDVLFDDITPWGRDAALIRQKLKAALGHRSSAALAEMAFEERIKIWREVAGAVPQRHQGERNPLVYAYRFAMDTIWPPTRFGKIFGAWAEEPMRAARVIARQHPRARYILLGHTHRPAIRQIPSGPLVINTGSFTAPFGGYTIELTPAQLRVRRVIWKQRAFRPGDVVADFPLNRS